MTPSQFETRLEVEVSQHSGNLLLRSSQDPLVSDCVTKLQTGTWKVEDAVSSCENDIKINQVCGNSHHNTHGLEYTTTPKAPGNKSSKHYLRYISDINQLMTHMPSPKWIIYQNYFHIHLNFESRIQDLNR